MFDKRTIIAIILTIMFFIYTVYDNHDLKIEFTSFYYESKALSANYDMVNDVDKFSATSHLVISDYIKLSEDSSGTYIDVHHNNATTYHYVLVDNNLIFKTLTSSEGATLCSNYCTGYYKLEEFIIRGRVINELEKYY